MNTTNNEDFMFPQFSMNGSVRERTIPTKVYTLYLDGEIGAPSEYRDHMEALESANEWDEVRVIISSGGGRLDSGLMLIDGIKACRAPVTAYIHDICGSMATGVALACQNWLLGDFAYFFVHTASWGTFGKDSEIRSHVQFMDKRIDKFLHSMYDGFMSSEEISLVGKGQDLWIDSEELKERLEAYQEYRNNQPCNCGDESCPQNQRLAAEARGEDFEDIEDFDLEALIAEKVAEGIALHEKKKLAAEKKASRAKKVTAPFPETDVK
jgi:Protease subunit of ATP-dependent Clp proteases